MKKYQPKDLEKKWQEKWSESKIYATDLTKPDKYYVLAEFAYPSGDLHVGHWFTFGGADIFARFKRMQGYNVFFPNGFDSFGLPAEGAAIKRNIHPLEWTDSNIIRMKEQFATLGASFDFYGDLASHKPIYYKWNQWIFLKMFEKGVAYRGKYLANWCPFDQTVLANEAVEAGKCWRCGSEVEQKEVEQWFFKIRDYADRLIWPEPDKNGLSNGVSWPQSVRDAQNAWIGKSSGAEVDFKIDSQNDSLRVFTTRIDTIFGATFLVIAPEHPLVSKLISEEQKTEVSTYLDKAKKKSELERKENKDKTGVFSGSFAVNPFSKEKIPVWIADYVLPGYGTGAIMAVPAHDERDFAFADKFGLPVKPVLKPITGNQKLFTGYGITFDSGEFSGLESSEAMQKMIAKAEVEGFGLAQTEYHIHDWSISRQRYWGTPIPIIHCPDCGMVPVPEAELPITLPSNVDYQPKGKSPLASNEEWLNVKCPKCKGDAKRDADTMDTFVDSSWYFFRFLDPKLETAPFDLDLAKKIMPVNIYFGGAEHTLGHTLYSRFFTKFFHDLDLTEIEEYALRRVNHGIVLGPDGQKMSKSKGNVVNPDDEVKKFGTDAVRLHVAFFMPYDGVGPWISDRIWGPYHFLERVWNLFDKVKEIEPSKEDLLWINKTIQKVITDIEAIKFNTAIASLMEWLNYLSKKPEISRKEYKTYLLLLAPFAPFIAEELWEMIGENYSIHQQVWPKVDTSKLVEETIKIGVQINGKVRDVIEVSPDDGEKEVIQKAMASEKVIKFLEGREPKKTIYVSGKILSFVI